MTQNERVKRHLEQFGKITSYEAFKEYGVTRLSARIWDLKHRYGLVITEERKVAKNRFNEEVYFAEYRLEGGRRESRRVD